MIHLHQRRARGCGCLIVIAFAVLALMPAMAADPARPTPSRGMAVMPFFVAKWTADADALSDNTLTISLAALREPFPSVKEGADRTLTRMVFNWLQVRFGGDLVPLEASRDAFLQMSVDQASDTPRKLAREIGEVLSLKQVVVGTVWRFRERGGIDSSEDSPASVAFAVYLVDVSSGQRLWRGRFDGTQKTLADMTGKTSIQGISSLKRLSVEELAKHAVNRVMKKHPLALPE